jgi:hypothetical protein
MLVIAHDALQSRVERLLRGDIREQDINHLFFNLREEQHGRGIVREIAHFLAHPKQRTQGIATTETRDLFAFLKFRMQIDQSKIIRVAMPANMPDAMRGNLRRMRPSILKREAGVSPPQAKRVLDGVLNRMSPTGHGGLTKPFILTQEEYDVFACVASNLKGGSLFTDDDLFNELCRILKKLHLLRDSERKAFANCKAAISLFALTAMHNRTIDLGDGSMARLSITADMYGNLGVFAGAEVIADYDGKGPTQVFAWLFQTELPVNDYCEDGVAPISRVPFIGELEMSSDLKLTRLI